MHNTTQTDNTEKCACGEVFCVQRHCFIALDETALLLRAVHAVRRVLWAFVASPLLVCHQACVEASKENAVPCAESAANLSSVAAHAPHASQHEMINCLKFYFLCLGDSSAPGTGYSGSPCGEGSRTLLNCIFSARLCWERHVHVVCFLQGSCEECCPKRCPMLTSGFHSLFLLALKSSSSPRRAVPVTSCCHHFCDHDDEEDEVGSEKYVFHFGLSHSRFC